MLERDLAVSAQLPGSKLFQEVPSPIEGRELLPGALGLTDLKDITTWLRNLEAAEIRLRPETSRAEDELVQHLEIYGPEAYGGAGIHWRTVVPVWETSTWVEPTTAAVIRRQVRQEPAGKLTLTPDVVSRIREMQPVVGSTEIRVRPHRHGCVVWVGSERAESPIECELPDGRLATGELSFQAAAFRTAVRYGKGGELRLNPAPQYSGVVTDERLFGIKPL